MCIPNGWKLVPVEPTPEMTHAGLWAPTTPDHLCEGGTESKDMAMQYQAMLKAAPTPPVQEDGVEYQFRDQHSVNMTHPGPWLDCSKESYERLQGLPGWDTRKLFTRPKS